MTLFGIDTSHWQNDAGFDLAVMGSVHEVYYVITKMSEGASSRDSAFLETRAAAEKRGVLFAAYHYVRGDSSAQAQVANMKVALDGHDVPVILDIERTNGSPQPSLVTMSRIIVEGKKQGVRISPLTYVPDWYWRELGAPKHDPFPLWQSRYGANDGKYFGDTSEYWNALGRQAQILQYTDRGRISGYSGFIDRNAYRGTREELAKTGWFKDYAVPKEPEVTVKEIQQAVRSTPILIDTEKGTEMPLQQVLRRLLDRKPARARDISEAVIRQLDRSGALNGNLQSGVIRDELEDIIEGILAAEN